MNPLVQLAVSLALTAVIWLAGYLVRRRLLQRLRDAGHEGPLDTDVGLEVSPGLMRAIMMTELAARLQHVLIGPIFVANFLLVNWIVETVLPGGGMS